MIDGKGIKNSSLPFSFSKIHMAKKSKNVGKTIGLIFLGLAIIGALAGSGVAISRYVSKKADTTTETTSNNTGTQQSGTSQGNESTNNGSSSSGSDNNSSGNNDSSSETENPGNSEHQTSATPTMNCSIGEVYWYNDANDSNSFNEIVYVAFGLPRSGLFFHIFKSSILGKTTTYNVSKFSSIYFFHKSGLKRFGLRTIVFSNLAGTRRSVMKTKLSD